MNDEEINYKLKCIIFPKLFDYHDALLKHKYKTHDDKLFRYFLKLLEIEFKLHFAKPDIFDRQNYIMTYENEIVYIAEIDYDSNKLSLVQNLLMTRINKCIIKLMDEFEDVHVQVNYRKFIRKIQYKLVH
ncbi:hypothetical protein N356_gp016 [Cellulophaga phage phi14:2]|uniref:Uncharacterized protein n=1 Tax=Cellulophaga phage phi14:2 TaxID=1327990 RepID=S0A0K4_9CAUD|nr:hypothetical protein N356_gp016 [Cellulophaga phage phi14:2]AGO48906.1 hypothetical protein Phi14:2_gp028 [Cellulophaga phage phi14:2]